MSIIEKIEALQIVYENEYNERKEEYTSAITRAKRDYKAVEQTDFSLDYKETYTASLESLENIFDDVATVQRRTHGIEFRVGDYIRTCRPRAIARGRVEDHFAQLVSECRRAIQTISKNDKIEADTAPLKAFAQGLVDLRYIVKNADKLLADSGIPAKEKEEELAKKQEKINRLQAEYKTVMQIEHFACYSDICALREEVIAKTESVKGDLLGARAPGFDGTYQILIGFSKLTLSSAGQDFALHIMGLSEEQLIGEPIYFHLRPECNTLLIKAPKKHIDSYDFYDWMCNLYFSAVIRFQPKALQFCGVECDANSVAGAIGDNIKEFDHSCLFAPIALSKEKIIAPDGVLQKLKAMCYAHNTEQRKQRSQQRAKNIFEYNELYPDNPQKFVMFLVNNYPAGFNQLSGDAAVNLLKEVVTAGTDGVFSVFCEATDVEYHPNAPMFEAEDLNADCLEFAKDGQVFYNGEPISLEITTPDFPATTYWETVGQYVKSAESKTLESLLATTKYNSDPDYITIPIGNKGGNPYCLNLKKYSNQLFGMIIGTIGSGKSSFLHTLLLSAAFSNSPDDLQFYLADFKSGEGSAAFDCYRKKLGIENLYLPHIRYLLLKGKTECALDLLKKMEVMRDEREKQYKALGCTNVQQYNEHPDVVSGRLPKIPTAIFVIDEYNAMLTGLHDAESGATSSSGGGDDVLTQIINKVKGLIGTLRSFGIGMLFCGQSVERSMKNSQALGNMGLRISLMVQTDNELISLFDMDSYDAKKQMSLLAGYGDALIAVGKPDTYSYVRTAYSGKENGSQQMRLAKSIREKYYDPKFDTPEYAQIDAGREDSVSYGELLHMESIQPPQKGEILLDLGITSASSLRVPLVYSTSDTATNYFAFANWNKLCKVEQNAIISFAEYVKQEHLSTEQAPITYLALPDYQRGCLGNYLNNHPDTRAMIDCKDSLTDMSVKIMELYEIFKARKREADRGIRRDFSPMLLVMHNVAWLNDSEKDVSWLPDFDAMVPQESAVEDIQITEQGKRALEFAKQKAAEQGKELSSEMISILMSRYRVPGTESKPQPKAQKTLRRFTARDVKEALGRLYARGNQYGLFVLVGTENYAAIDQVLTVQSQDKSMAYSRYSIFGSLEEMKTHKEDRNASPTCVYLSYFGTKVRLCDYTKEEA